MAQQPKLEVLEERPPLPAPARREIEHVPSVGVFVIMLAEGVPPFLEVVSEPQEGWIG